MLTRCAAKLHQRKKKGLKRFCWRIGIIESKSEGKILIIGKLEIEILES